MGCDIYQLKLCWTVFDGDWTNLPANSDNCALSVQDGLVGDGLVHDGVVVHGAGGVTQSYLSETAGVVQELWEREEKQILNTKHDVNNFR